MTMITQAKEKVHIKRWASFSPSFLWKNRYFSMKIQIYVEFVTFCCGIQKQESENCRIYVTWTSYCFQFVSILVSSSKCIHETRNAICFKSKTKNKRILTGVDRLSMFDDYKQRQYSGKQTKAHTLHFDGINFFSLHFSTLKIQLNTSNDKMIMNELCVTFPCLRGAIGPVRVLVFLRNRCVEKYNDKKTLQYFIVLGSW